LRALCTFLASSFEAHECMGRFEESKGSFLVFFRGANAWIDALGFKKCLIKGRELKTLSTVFLGGNVTTVVHESD
tara:strand:- start:323 stop:547 length:225 start_codon:yes stop_codon:yes gene_type:complete